ERTCRVESFCWVGSRVEGRCRVARSCQVGSRVESPDNGASCRLLHLGPEREQHAAHLSGLCDQGSGRKFRGVAEVSSENKETLELGQRGLSDVQESRVVQRPTATGA